MTNLEKIRELSEDLDEKEAVVRAQWLYSPALICIFTETHLLDVNPAWSVLGWTKDELLAKSFYDFIHPDDAEKTREIAKLILDERIPIQSSNFSNRYLCKDGSYKTIEWFTIVITNRGKMYGVGRVA